MNMPKCLVPVAGRRIIDYQLELLKGVEDVRVVVGFMEELVIEHVKSVRSDVIFVRNPDYARTSTLQSLYLATRNLDGPYLALDGDVVLERESFEKFLQLGATCVPLIGIAEASTEDAVFVRVRETSGGRFEVEGFQRQPPTPFEWTGIAFLDNSIVRNENRFMFHVLEERLPLPAARIRCIEVDTPSDLSRANQLLQSNWR
jgi:choline kinase